MNEEQIKEIEGLLIAAFLSMEQIAARVGVSVSIVEKIMANMEVPLYDE